MHIGAADPYRLDADLHFAGAGIGQLGLYKAELPKSA